MLGPEQTDIEKTIVAMRPPPWGREPTKGRSVSSSRSRRLPGAGFGSWSGREDLNLDSFPGREACCNYTTSATPASDEPDTFVV
jgi:hypothetical protein